MTSWKEEQQLITNVASPAQQLDVPLSVAPSVAPAKQVPVVLAMLLMPVLVVLRRPSVVRYSRCVDPSPVALPSARQL
jgi:hypothetical protein